MMSERTKIMLVISAPIIVLYVFISGIWSPYRWGMYKGAVEETALVSFHGKVVDTHGTPLKDVEVTVRFGTVDWLFIFGTDSPRKNILYFLKTDNLGRFSLEGLHGYAVYIDQLNLPGYVFKPRFKNGAYATAFYYAGGGVGREGPYIPDPNKPAIFEMAPINDRRDK